MSDWSIINGDMTQEGKIPIDDRGFMLGDGLFETIPLYYGAPLYLDRHFDRLKKGCETFGFLAPVTLKLLKAGIERLAGKNNVSRGVARLTVTRGPGKRGYAPPEEPLPAWVLTVNHYEPMSEACWNKGFLLWPVSIRKKRGSLIHSVKTTSAIEKVMMMAEAQKNGADEALALTDAGEISSAVSANIFWVKNDVLHTPSKECVILPGVTRSLVIKIAGEEGIKVREGCYQKEALAEADEIFLTNSLVEITPIRDVSGLAQPVAPGKVTKRLAARYRGRIPEKT